MRLWDVDSDTPRHTMDRGERQVRAAAFAPDGQTFVTGAQTGVATIWDAKTGQPLKELKTSEQIFDVDFCPSGDYVATAHGDKKVRVWSVASAKVVLELEEGHEFYVATARYSADGGLLVTGCWGRQNSTARVWDAHSGALLSELKGHTYNLKCAAFSGDTSLVITGSEDKTAKVWSWRTAKCLQTLRGHTNKVMCVALAGTGDGEWQAVTGGMEGDVRCWNVQTGECIRTTSLSGSATSISFLRQGTLQLLVTSGNDIVALDFNGYESPASGV